MARGALTNDKAFERFGYQMFELVPQLDRVCVTTIDKRQAAAEDVARTTRPEDVAAQQDRRS